jgi:hypothetical protein
MNKEKFDFIEGSNGEALQDSFVLNINAFKTQGFYLEIGAGPPILGNNTYLLEKKYEWFGLSVENDNSFVNEFLSVRKNPIMNENALSLNYSELLNSYGFPKQVDFLQIDIDTPINNLSVLQKIPLDEYRFSVIVFEHDSYRDNFENQVKDKAAKILNEYGYIRIVNNVKIVPKKVQFKGSWQPFEDWWVDGQYVNQKYTADMFQDTPWVKVFNIPFKQKMTVYIANKVIQMSWQFFCTKRYLYNFKLLRKIRKILHSKK